MMQENLGSCREFCSFITATHMVFVAVVSDRSALGRVDQPLLASSFAS